MAVCTTNDDEDDRSMTGILCIGARTETVSYVTTTAAHLDVAVNRKLRTLITRQQHKNSPVGPMLDMFLMLARSLLTSVASHDDLIRCHKRARIRSLVFGASNVMSTR